MSKHAPLLPSELGTKSYWEATYETESQNFSASAASAAADEGQIWFSESRAEQKIISYILSSSSSSSSSPKSTKSSSSSRPNSFLDVGCGNGHLLFTLFEELVLSQQEEEQQLGQETGGRFVGIDYSEKGIALARSIAAHHHHQVEFFVVDVVRDVMDLSAPWVPKGGFDVVVDKGTFDAISLSGEVLEDGSGRRRVEDVYAERVAAVMRCGGLLVLTSCNWTEEELKRRILECGDFKYHGRIAYPTFSFGGKKGQTISTVCFEKKK